MDDKRGTFVTTSMVRCNNCKWEGRPWSQETVYGEQYERGYETQCPECESNNLTSFEGEPIRMPLLGG